MNKNTENFVYIDENNLLGSNFYWHKGNEVGMTKKELASVGLENERVLIHADIVSSLKDVDKMLQKKGYRLYITEGYRSKELYNLINKKNY